MSTSGEAMETGSSESMKQKAEALRSLATGPLWASIAELSGSAARSLPSEKDFNFCCNFDEFKAPVQEIADASHLMLDVIGSSTHLWGEYDMGFPNNLDIAYDWLANVNNELLEKLDAYVDEFQRLRMMEEESPVESEDGFQLVSRKKKGVERNGCEEASSSSAVKAAFKSKKELGTKSKIPFHDASIRRPQDEFKIVVNNSNQPFQHVFLQKSEDGSRFIHPLEKFSVLDFVDKNVGDIQPVEPSSTESTPFTFVNEVKDLKDLAEKLRGVNEFAVDLEHNQYRSFQGLTCLMQISTRTEDFVVDTLKLRAHVGPCLRGVFKDPKKKKVLHGADSDILWLQKDFGIYVCNMFDTGQASRVLKLERNSLEYLLYHFCGVTANKEYQNADWRIRPLPDVMLRYAREDTHYLLYIFDLMRTRLVSSSNEPDNSDDLLLEVYKRSYDICMQLYEKELLTDTSYLHLYGVHSADFRAQQLAIISGLYEWRDVVARAEDESTGYIMPNKTLLEIAKQMPVTFHNLRRLVNPKHPYVERNLNSILRVIRHSMQNAIDFEAVAERLKKERLEKMQESKAKMAATEANAVPAKLKTVIGASTDGLTVNGSLSVKHSSPVHLKVSLELTSNNLKRCSNGKGVASECTGQNRKTTCQTNNAMTLTRRESPNVTGQIREKNMNFSPPQLATEASAHKQKKPSHPNGEMLGNSTAVKKFEPDKKEKQERKLDQTESTVSLPSHPSSSMPKKLPALVNEPAKVAEEHVESSRVVQARSSSLDVILLDDDSSEEEEFEGREREEAANKPLDDRERDGAAAQSDSSSSFSFLDEDSNESAGVVQPEALADEAASSGREPEWKQDGDECLDRQEAVFIDLSDDE